MFRFKSKFHPTKSIVAGATELLCWVMPATFLVGEGCISNMTRPGIGAAMFSVRPAGAMGMAVNLIPRHVGRVVPSLDINSSPGVGVGLERCGVSGGWSGSGGGGGSRRHRVSESGTVDLGELSHQSLVLLKKLLICGGDGGHGVAICCCG